MSDPAFTGIPEALMAAVRGVDVPRELRRLFDRVSLPIALEVALPTRDAPKAALQLVRLATEGASLKLQSLEVAPQLRVRLSYGEKDMSLEPEDFEAGTSALAGRIALTLLSHEEAARALERFAREAPRQDALRRLTRAMLETSSIDRLRTIMLLGMTSGLGLGLRRAALFVYDEDGRALVGESAIGPADAEEAAQTVSRPDARLEQLLTAAAEADPRFEELVRTIAVDVTTDPGDEIGQALAASGPLLFARERPVNPAIAALAPPREFLVSAIRLRGRPIGIVIADNRYSEAAIDPECLEFVGFLLDTAALASENLRLVESVETLARHDALTGLFNRREFESRMIEEQSRCLRVPSQCGLLLFDVDHMQQLNEARGHKAGDELLQSIGVLLRSTLRSHDIVARHAGDAFAVLVTDTTTEQVLAIARRVGAQALEMGVSLSAGGSVWPRDNQEMSVLFAEADAALTEAKQTGRGRACIVPNDGPLVFAPPGDDETLFT